MTQEKKEANKRIHTQVIYSNPNLQIQVHVVAPGDLDLVVDEIIKEFGWRRDEDSVSALEWYVKAYGYNAFLRVFFDVSEEVAKKRGTRFPIRNPAGYFRAQLSQRLGPLPAALQRKLAVKQHLKQHRRSEHDEEQPSGAAPLF